VRVLDNGCAYWLLGSIVEVSLCGQPDVDHYRARCLTGGTFPQIRILDEKYPEPLQGRAVDPPFVIWREIAESEEAEQEAIEQQERLLDECREDRGLFVIVGSRPKHIRIVRAEDDTPVEDTFKSLEAAREWLDCRVCAACGYLVADVDGPVCSQQHIGVSKGFAF
jgi:hypothetical protein